MTLIKRNVETVRGRLGDERREQLLSFWAGQGALQEDEARRRLDEVVCLLVDGDGEIAGVNSVYAEDVRLLGGRRFWVYRSFVVSEGAGEREAMINAAFEALAAEFDPAAGGPIGLCVGIGDRAEIEKHPEAVWPETGLMYAGYLDDGPQVRIRYFEGAAIGPGAGASESDTALQQGYRIDLFAEQDAVGVDDVTALWGHEGVVGAEEANRRVHQVLLVATHESGELVGVSSAYLQRNPQLRMDLWYYRAFVAKPHRQSNVAVNLATMGRDHLEGRFVSGADTRAAGALYEVENPGLKSYFNLALWLPTRFTFIGENERGDHVRVHYFPGALAPLPD
jgi:hypothetical protein